MVAIFPASTTAGGNCFAVPDTCLTPAPPAPPVPVPYPNTGMVNQAKKTAKKVKFAKKPVVTKKSELSRTMGDEAGVNKGVMSGMNMGKLTFKMGTTKVKIEGQDCIRHTSMAGHNGMSANMPAGTQVAPSQTKVIVAP
ncbi:MAG: PAAR-like domain-containing protein [Pseudomonadota bacterium]